MSGTSQDGILKISLLQVSGKKANQDFQKKRCVKATTPILRREEANLSQKSLNVKAVRFEHDIPKET